ncbi:MAG: hypothetical protein NC112_02490 [Oxalobacter formigenes]|nr:hypothetical protein [Oxalobacter formigenes]
MIHKSTLENIGINVPEDASRFFTQDSNIIFLIPSADEYGYSIIIEETSVKIPLTTQQIEALKTANCYGETGWTLI